MPITLSSHARDFIFIQFDVNLFARTWRSRD